MMTTMTMMNDDKIQGIWHLQNKNCSRAGLTVCFDASMKTEQKWRQKHCKQSWTFDESEKHIGKRKETNFDDFQRLKPESWPGWANGSSCASCGYELSWYTTGNAENQLPCGFSLYWYLRGTAQHTEFAASQPGPSNHIPPAGPQDRDAQGWRAKVAPKLKGWLGLFAIWMPGISQPIWKSSQITDHRNATVLK